jgi:hypothetical protein
LSPVPKKSKVKTYAASGRRISDSSVERAERLANEGLVILQRDRMGRIRCMQFRRDAWTGVVRKSPPNGTKTSYAELLPSGHHAWRHRALPNLCARP